MRCYPRRGTLFRQYKEETDDTHQTLGNMGSIETSIFAKLPQAFYDKMLFFDKGILEENQATEHTNRLVVNIKIKVTYELMKENNQVSSDR